MSQFTVIYDACVLYPESLRDLLMQLATTGMYRAKWTERIQDEWTENVLKNNPHLKRERLTRTRQLMNEHALDCLVTGYERLENSISLPDPDDRHVVAAAIVGKAEVIVTFNLKDFPTDELAAYNIEAQHPDDFINNLIDLSQAKVCEAAKICRARRKHPPIDVADYIACFARQKLPQTASFLREMAGLI
ncbi:MAG: PIN domain-containing protein [Opitutales bacterium]|jgi:predicted nucleic acid-binding protein